MGYTFLVFLIALPWSFAGEEIAVEGRPAPPISLKDEWGKVITLDDFKGYPLTLYFTHNLCHYCTQLIGFLKEADGKWRDKGLRILTINVMAKDARLVKAYREAYNLPFPQLVGKDEKVLRSYEINYVPVMVFIQNDGIIKRIYHHFVLKQDFYSSIKEIVE